MRKALLLFNLAATLLVVSPARTSAESITIADSGGTYSEVMRRAVYTPVTQRTGIEIRVDHARTFADFRLQVQSGRPSWDMAGWAIQNCRSAEAAQLFEEIDYSVVTNAQDLPPEFRGRHWVGGSTIYSIVLAWNKKKYGNNPPTGWADFFDVRRFPGTRALYNQPRMMLELVLLADGVPRENLYPLDVERALRRVTEFRRNITVFYDSYGQAAQLLKSGEIDMMALINGRVEAVIEDGADVAYTMDQGINDMGCLFILKGSPRVATAMRALNVFIDRELQANIPLISPYSPVNPRAHDTGKIPPARERMLASYPANAARMTMLNSEWWAANEARVIPLWQAVIQRR